MVKYERKKVHILLLATYSYFINHFIHHMAAIAVEGQFFVWKLFIWTQSIGYTIGNIWCYVIGQNENIFCEDSSVSIASLVRMFVNNDTEEISFFGVNINFSNLKIFKKFPLIIINYNMTYFGSRFIENNWIFFCSSLLMDFATFFHVQRVR